MKTNVLIVLDTRKPLADGTYALLLRIIHGSTSAQISLKKYFAKKDWDENARLVKPSYRGTESVMRLNNWISTKKTELADFITKLDEKKILKTLTHANQIKNLFERGQGNPSFTAYMQTLIDRFMQEGRIGNARAYKSVLSALRTHVGKQDILFAEVNYQFLMDLQTAHLAKRNSYNGLAVYLRTIRAVYGYAMKAGLVDRETYPFTEYTIKTSKTRKRAILKESIEKIEMLELKPGHPLYHTRHTFLFCYYTRGMPFADMALLKLSNIIDGRIFYQRQKTDKPYSIKIISEIHEILDCYIQGKETDDYIFNIVKRVTEADIYKDIEWARARYNEKLVDLAKLCGIEEKLTSYVARHSFATAAKFLKMPTASISDMLGHGSIKTTEIYLASLPDEMLDEEHEKIVRSKGKKQHK